LKEDGQVHAHYRKHSSGLPFGVEPHTMLMTRGFVDVRKSCCKGERVWGWFIHHFIFRISIYK